MTEPTRPRHIRDIAHLYLSRRRTPETSGTGRALDLLLTSSGRDCMPGFHAANIATVFAQKNAEVRVYELSGVLPNASFYFAHPAALYLGRLDGARARFLPALPGVSVAFDLDARPGRGHGERERVVTLYCLPPDDAADGPDFWRRLAGSTNDRWQLHLAGDGARNGARPTPSAGVTARGRFVLDVGVAEQARGGEASVGGLGDWRWALVDRLPVVLRNPTSRLAAAYHSTCESVLARITSRRGVHDGESSRRAISSGRPR